MCIDLVIMEVSTHAWICLMTLFLTQVFSADCRARMFRPKNLKPLKDRKLPSTRIFGGATVNQTQFPFQVLLREDCYLICGGSVINEWTVMTAAHCINQGNPYCGRRYPDIKPELYTIEAGKTTTFTEEATVQLRNVTNIIVHPEYDDVFVTADIALLHLATPLVFNEHVSAVQLSDSTDSTYDLAARHDRCVVSGWGLTDKSGQYPGVLMNTEVSLVSNQRCNKKWTKRGYASIPDSNICTFNRRQGPCSGDSGGPMGCYDGNNVYCQVGIYSWGPTNCNLQGTVYTRVSSFLAWVQNNTHNGCYCVNGGRND